MTSFRLSLSAMAALRRLAGWQRLLGLPRLGARGVSSGDKAQSAASVQVPPTSLRARLEQDEDDMQEFIKNPDYHGFDSDPYIDLWSMRIAFFFGLSIFMVCGATFVHYMPPSGYQDWARREAERVVKNRQAQGLPPIDRFYFDPSKIVLPPEEEE